MMEEKRAWTFSCCDERQLYEHNIFASIFRLQIVTSRNFQRVLGITIEQPLRR
jgi:hypothetical protein